MPEEKLKRKNMPEENTKSYSRPNDIMRINVMKNFD